MTSKVLFRFSLCSVLLLAGCSSEGPDREGADPHILAIPARTITSQMVLPSGLDTAAFLVAQNKVQIDSSVSVPGAIWSAGTMSMQPDARAQSVICTGNVVLSDRDTINVLTLGGTLTKGNGNVIGTLTRTQLSNATHSASVTFPPASRTVTLNSGQSQTLSPGSYVSVTVNSGATLTLLAGDYYVGSLTLQSSSVLKLSPTQGATRIFIASGLAYRPTLAAGADASRFFVEYLGTSAVVLETPFAGSIVAPRAPLLIGTAASQTHRGSFMAQSIEVQPYAKLEFVKFNGAGTVSSCPADTWDPDGNPFTPCVAKTVCAAGTYVSSEGTTTSDRVCTGCASGQFSTATNAPGCTAWTTCFPGTYVSNVPSSTTDRACLACPDGQYSSGNNQSQCLGQGSCPAGTVQTAPGTPTSAAVCAPCVAGQYCAGGSCPPTTCTDGTWDNDADPATVCVAKTTCVAGTFVISEGSTTTDRTCASCASGTFSTDSNTAVCADWTTCFAGSFAANPPSATVERVCSPCPVGQFSNSNNQTGCQPQGSCAAGSVETAPGTATSPAMCEACEPGNYCAGGTNPPLACPAGTWDQDGSPASPCVAKTDCVPGSFVSSEGGPLADRVCASCGSGQFSTANNAPACAPWSTCEPGTFVSNTPSATMDRVCANCPSGQYSSAANQSSCQDQGACAAGTVQTAAGTPTSPAVCQACVAGQYCAGGTNPATTCAAGTWDQDQDPATPCAPMSVCGPGAFMATDGTPASDRLCTSCADGTFSTTANAPECIVWTICEAGTYAANTPSATVDRVCVPCSSNGSCGLPPLPRGCRGGGFGDPHLITWDGRAIDVQAAGEFVLASDGGGFVIEFRTESVGTNVSAITAIAARVGSNVIMFSDRETPPLRVDGVPSTVPSQGLFLSGGGRVDIQDGDRYLITWPTGEALVLQTAPTISAAPLTVAPCRGAGPGSGGLVGLMGNGNGDLSDDLRSSGGGVVDPNGGFGAFSDFVNSWRVQASDSLFTYAAGTGPETYQVPGFPTEPRTAADLDPSAYSWALGICNAAAIDDPVLLDACILDVGATGDPAWASIYSRLGSEMMGSSVGDVCADGSFRSGTSGTSCTPWSNCPAGTYVSNTPSATADRICTACPPGQTSSGENATSCISAASISAGALHTCAIVAGGVQCWGNNSYGQLGDGGTTARALPGPVSGLGAGSGVTAIASGTTHTCALVSGGVMCWGENRHGQIGDGTTTTRTSPVWVSGLRAGAGVTAIAGSVDAYATCAVVSGGVKCWGDNSDGQLGDGTTVERHIPVSVSGLLSGAGVTAISCGQMHACAVVGGGARCWGNNNYGQLGDGTIMTGRRIPVQVSGLVGGVTAIAAGSYHTCAVVNSGVQCWGHNGSNQLGDGTTNDRFVPGPVVGLGAGSGVTAIAGGRVHTFAVVGGGLKGWGYNGSGWLGDGTLTIRSTPVSVFADGVGAVGAGPFHSCAWASGLLRCWGQNNHGQLGDGTITYDPRPTPTLVLFP